MLQSNKAVGWIDQNKALLVQVSDQIWSYAEPALQEHRSSRLMQKTLEENGFSVKAGLAHMPTAFRAEWGSGKPVIGFLAEFDALPGLSQRATAEREPIEEHGPGHGCGHNLLGTAALGAALALKHELERDHIPGTVVLFGCPAEETMTGKIFMARAGVFDDLDVAIAWHPASFNGVLEQSFLAMNSVKFRFIGKSAHAAMAPEQGRSALDAVELMNTGVNYLREHVPSDVRIHYTITDGGGEPNVVPSHAQSWYYIRAPKRNIVDDVYDRIVDIARGACLMTETKLEIGFQSGCYHPLENRSLNALLHECLTETAPPGWSEEDLDFAKKLSETFAPGQKEAQLSVMGGQALKDQYLHQDILPLTGTSFLMPGSTDVSDVSWIAPTAQLMTCCQAIGTAGHTWQVVAAGGMEIGHKGMLYAARAMTLAGSRLVRNNTLLEKIRTEFMERSGGKRYRCVVPEDVFPACDNP